MMMTFLMMIILWTVAGMTTGVVASILTIGAFIFTVIFAVQALAVLFVIIGVIFGINKIRQFA